VSELRDSKEQCPECDQELQGDPIPVKQQHMFGASHYSLKIGIYDHRLDRTIAWRCPFCSVEWARTEATTPGFFRTTS